MTIDLRQQLLSCHGRGIPELTLGQLQKFTGVFDMNIRAFMNKLFM